jgi:hypothetical protein
MSPLRRDDEVPVARVFREAGRPARPIPVPFSVRARGVLGPVGNGARVALNAALGMWPLTAVLLLAALLLILAGRAGSP